MKLLIETTGNFKLLNGGFEIPENRPCVPPVINHFIQSRISLGQISILAKLKDEATDEDFLGYFKEADGDSVLAVASFEAAFGLEEITKKEASLQIEMDFSGVTEPLEDNPKNEDMPEVSAVDDDEEKPAKRGRGKK